MTRWGPRSEPSFAPGRWATQSKVTWAWGREGQLRRKPCSSLGNRGHKQAVRKWGSLPPKSATSGPVEGKGAEGPKGCCWALASRRRRGWESARKAWPACRKLPPLDEAQLDGCPFLWGTYECGDTWEEKGLAAVRAPSPSGAVHVGADPPSVPLADSDGSQVPRISPSLDARGCAGWGSPTSQSRTLPGHTRLSHLPLHTCHTCPFLTHHHHRALSHLCPITSAPMTSVPFTA